MELSYLSILDNSGAETLGILDIDGLNVAVQLLLGTFLVVTLAADADTETEGDTLDTGFPDLLVQLGVEADVFGAHSLGSESANLLDGAGSTLLEGNTVHLFVKKKRKKSVFRPKCLFL
jgi:hypothetical protein